MTELDEAIREHLELRRRRGIHDEPPEAPEPPAPTVVAVAEPQPPPSRPAPRPAAPARPPARDPAPPPAEVPDLPRLDWSDVDVELGLLSTEERRTRRDAAHRRAQRLRRLRLTLLPVAALVGLAFVVAAAVSAIPGGQGRGPAHSRNAAAVRRVALPATYPFAQSPAQRRPGPADKLEPFWADGQPCSVGCRASGVVPGWPLRPFHAQHALRAGLNEQRTTSFHHGIDIQAYDLTRVYAIQPGRAHIIQATGADSRVQVGNFIYWHIHPTVREGQPIAPYRQVVGWITPGHGHLHLSEVDAANRYLNPLRPGGRAVAPYSDTEPPVIGRPRFTSSGQVVLPVFDPQSFRVHTTYDTPVIAPAAVAYRVFDTAGNRLGSLHWALRGSQNLDWTPGVAAAIYAQGSRPEQGSCFEHRPVCRPDYRYLLAGGLAPALTQVFLPAGRYRLTAYAWDWTGNASARDALFTVRPDGTIGG
jgi:hypothetical protein